MDSIEVRLTCCPTGLCSAAIQPRDLATRKQIETRTRRIDLRIPIMLAPIVGPALKIMRAHYMW